MRLCACILSFIGEKKYQQILKKNRHNLVEVIDRVSDNLGGKDTVLRFLKIKKRTYLNWNRFQNSFCKHSLTKLCYKKYPNQISRSEIKVLEKYMNTKRYAHWSIKALWGKAVRLGDISMGESTWYKYTRELGYSEKRKSPKKPRKKYSFKASKPNETWHADVSQIMTSDNIKYYFYRVVDNFSRKILIHKTSTKLSGEIRTQTIKEAISQEFSIDLQGQSVELIVDGGSENNNRNIHDFIKHCHVNIDKKIALKDVTFSNSVVEGSYKTMKSGYFKYRPIHSSMIHQETDWFVDDYNKERPHDVHKWYTPDEIHQNPNLKNVRPHPKNIKKRIQENRNYCCLENGFKL
jgi:transposase InsO family protein